MSGSAIMDNTQIRVRGTLAEDARNYVNPNGSAGVIVLVGPAATDSVAVEAHRYYGKGPAAQIAAASAAQHMRRGCRVTVHAAGWRVRADRLVLTEVSHIEHQPVVPARATLINEELHA